VANLTDHHLMCVAETVFGTPVAVSRAVPFLPDSTHEWNPTPYQGKGLWVGAPGGVFRADRRGAGIGQGKLVEKYEAQSKGLGVALNAALGTSTHTLTTGTTYQQVFTPTVTGTVLPSRTVQYATVQNGGTASPHTYAGVSVDSLELEIPEGPDGIATWTLESDAKSLATATSAGTFTPAASASLFGSWSTAGVVTLGGTVTAPTTTVLASSNGTTVTDLLSLTLSVKNNLDVGRWGIGTRGQPTVGRRELSVKWKQEFNATTVRDLLISQGNTALLVTLQTGEALSTGNATLQLAIPAMKVDTGSLPNPTDGETVVSDVEATILWDGTNQPLYVVTRTADTAL
jgi:hypothetical protein